MPTRLLIRDDSHGVSGRYDSIAVSCHKFFGFPSPAGLFITRQSLYAEFNELFSEIHNPEYIHHVPGTITCSRDAVKPAEFFYFTTPTALAKQAEDAELMLEQRDLSVGPDAHKLPAAFGNASQSLVKHGLLQEPR